MLVLNTLAVITQFVLVALVAVVSMNIVKYLSIRMAPVFAPAVFVNHGGGPLPLLGDKDHRGLTTFLRDELRKFTNVKDFKAIILVTAHWEEDQVTISSGEKHNLYFDYYGFPPESYHYKYPAPGNPTLAKRIQEALNKEGVASRLDPNRGWDHGVFVPMMLINPDADVPIVQISVLTNQDPAEHFKIGQILSQFRKEGIAIIGSGMSFHNMREFRSARLNPAGGVINENFDNYLLETCTAEEDKRREELLAWRKQVGASEAHPPGAAEHFMPLVVIAGAGGKGKGERIFNWDMAGLFRLSGFIYRGE